MKTNKILVGVNGAVMSLQSGAKVVAIYPAGKGDTESCLLLTDGKMAVMKGARILGVGVARYFTEHDFELAKPGNPDAENLADMVDAREGTSLVERHSSEYAQTLARELGGQQCTFVPFATDKPIVPVTVEPPRGIMSTAFDLLNGFAAGQVAVEYRPESRDCGMGANLSTGWLVGPSGQPEQMPRSTEYGGVVEHAVFVICNSGLGRLVGAQNLEMDEDAPLDAMYPRGKMEICLNNGDRLTVGITAVDELGVHYTRDGVMVYAREGMVGEGVKALKLGSVIGAIAAVLVRVQEMDADSVKVPRARVKKVS